MSKKETRNCFFFPLPNMQKNNGITYTLKIKEKGGIFF
jgi:hypothetical protein